MLESYDHTLIVFVFMAILMSYCPPFLGSICICMTCQTRYMFEIYDQKLVICVFMAVFMSYWPYFWGSRAIYIDLKTRYMFESYDQKLSRFNVYGPQFLDSSWI